MAKAQQQQSNRSDARAAATGGAQGGSTGRSMPKQEAAEGTDANAQAEAPKPSALVLIVDNPKRKGSQAFDFFAKYPKRHTMSDVDAAKLSGVRGKDLSWDADPRRRHILIGPEAENFPCDGTREEQAEYLHKLDPKFFSDEMLIKRGYKDAPVKEEAEATQTQNA